LPFFFVGSVMVRSLRKLAKHAGSLDRSHVAHISYQDQVISNDFVYPSSAPTAELTTQEEAMNKHGHRL
jgi:hypothetical protein